jgi:hypothetical protein
MVAGTVHVKVLLTLALLRRGLCAPASGAAPEVAVDGSLMQLVIHTSGLPEQMLEVEVHAPDNSEKRVDPVSVNSSATYGLYSTACVLCGVAGSFVIADAGGMVGSLPNVTFNPSLAGVGFATHFTVRTQGDICTDGNVSLTLSGVTASGSCAKSTACSCEADQCQTCQISSPVYPDGIPNWNWGENAIDLFYDGADPDGAALIIESAVIDVYYFVNAQAIGDPHMQNIHGQRFDLMQPGLHALIQIPRGEPAEAALLRVEAEARHLGPACADVYFQSLNITGAWVDPRQAGGFRFRAQGSGGRGLSEWLKFGAVEAKVVRGQTRRGERYLNLHVRHLGEAGFSVGGLLGEDDHTVEATPVGACSRALALHQAGSVRRESSGLS